MKDKHESFESVENISEELDTLNEYILKYWKHFIFAGLAVVFLIGVGMTFRQSSRTASIKAATELEQAQSVPELQKALQDHPANPASDLARLRLGTLLYNEGKYDEARKLFDKVRVAGNLPAWLGKLDEAYATEAKGDLAGAAEKFKAIGDSFNAPAHLRCQANYESGRLYLLNGDKEKAKSRLSLCVSDKKMKWDLWPDLAEKTLERMN